MNEIFVFLLPLAAFTGWWLARNDKASSAEKSRDSEYFQGLGYLLDGETDKAIDIFMRIAHLDDSAIENQITLGNLFRKRGELDRALHIHSSLADRSEVTDHVADNLNFALAEDYYSAGILNHAIDYYQSVINNPQSEIRQQARKRLIQLYADQAEWEKAIELVEEFDPLKSDPIQHNVAHFYCEIATQQLASEDKANHLLGEERLKKALECDKNCVRANVLLGRKAMREARYITAIGYFQAIEKQDPQFLLEVLDDMDSCYQHLNQQEEWFEFVKRIEKNQNNAILTLRVATMMETLDGQDKAIEFILKKINTSPSILILQRYLLYLTKNSENSEEMTLLSNTLNKLVSITLKYRCIECGFRGNQLNWQCPGCKCWGGFTPISDLSFKENI